MDPPLRLLLARLIDYAGQFPPAQLSLADALDEYREASAGPFAWLLGPFLCPAGRIGELLISLAGSAADEEPPLPVGVIARSVDQVATAVAFMAGAAGVRLDRVELPRPDDASRVFERLTDLDPVPAVYLEARAGAPMAGEVAAIAELRARADGVPVCGKVRCGGIGPSGGTPEPADLAEFISAAVAARLPFKATAGLHHPFRHLDRDLDVWQHGFVNLLAATQAAVGGANREEVAAVLDVTDGTRFRLGRDGLEWGSRYDRVTPSEVRRALHGYGSCSFAEPVDDLITLGVVEVDGTLRTQ
jgi:hypothetical protein